MSYNTELQNNNAELQAILEMANNLPEAGESVTDAVRYTEQILTDAQKAQARENIDALGESDLQGAVNDALSQAKASGEFDGKDGADGNDYVLTDADKAEMVSDVIAALPESTAVLYISQTLTNAQKERARANIDAVATSDLLEIRSEIEELQEFLNVNPIFGIIDENNNIILSGTLADGEYTLKYENNGDYIEIGTLTVGEGEPDVAPDTTIVWAKGTKIDSTTGKETTGNTGYSASNYIAIVSGYAYKLTKTASAEVSSSAKVCYYDANNAFIKTSADVIAQNTGATTATIPLIDGAAYFRLRHYGTASQLDDGDWILTAEVSV
jgi:hypothetical protein